MGLEFNTLSWDNLLKQLGGENAQRAERKIVGAVVKKLFAQTKQNIQSRFPNSSSANPNYSDKIIDGLRSYVKKNDIYETEGIVHILGTRNKGSQTYKLRFYENGTQPRYTSNGAYRGMIKPLHFFGDAVSAVETQMMGIMQTELDNYISSINEG